jgi:branched-chain amino acid transport system permease protein
VQAAISIGVTGLSLGVQYALISIGFTLIFGILGVINFAHGAFYALGGYFAYTLFQELHLPFFLAVVFATLATGMVGYVVEMIAIDKYVEDHLATMLITLGIYQMITTLLTAVFGADPIRFRFPLSGVFRTSYFYVSYANLTVLGVCTAAIVGVYYLVFKTRYGIALRAMADNGRIARTQRISPATMFPMAFAIASGLAGLTGALISPILSLDPSVGSPIIGKAFIVVILGGLGSISGATVAAFVVGLIEAYSSVYLGGSRGALVLFVLVMVMLLVRPQGLLGTVARKA